MRWSSAVAAVCLLATAVSIAGGVPDTIRRPTSIEPQGLASALQRLARERDIQIVYRSELVGDRRTGGAVGELTLEEVLTQLLSGTDLTYRYIEGNGITIVPASGARSRASAAPADRFRLAQGELSPAAQEAGAQQAAADSSREAAPQDAELQSVDLEEVTIRSTRMLISVGKTPASVRETPHSISIINRQRMEEQNLLTLEDAMKEVTGLTMQNAGNGHQEFYSRGYAISTVQLDGVPTEHSPWNIMSPDLVMYDRVEVLRGPDALYSGAGVPGGSVNLVRKKPLNRFQVLASATAASDSLYRGEADVTGPLTESGSLRARLIGAYEDRGFFYDFGDSRSKMVFGSVAYDITPGATVTAGIEYRDYDEVPYTAGLPRYSDGRSLGLPRSTFLNAAWNKEHYRGVTPHLELQQNFRDDWFLRVTATRVDARAGYKNANIIGGAVVGEDGLFAMEGWFSKYDDVQDGIEALVSGSVSLFGRKHDVQLGANWQKHRYVWDDYWLDMGDAQYDVFDFDPRSVPEPADSQFLERYLYFSHKSQKGVFGRARIRLSDRLRLIGGGRVSWYDSWFRGMVTSGEETILDEGSKTKQSGQFTPYVAAVFDLSRIWSTYASFTRSFEPQGDLLTYDRHPLPPKLGTNVEIGLKGELLEGRVNASLAAFRINETNRPQDDLLHPPVGQMYFYVASGEVRSEGVELEINGAITPSWALYGGYTYNTTEYLDDQYQQGQVFSSFTPKSMAKLWTTFQPQRLERRLSLGLGVVAQSGQYLLGDTVRIEQGPYAVLSARVGYQLSDRTSVALNVDNLADERYYASLGGTDRKNYYGAPRSFALTVRTRY